MHELGAGLTYLPTFDDAESLRRSVREALNNGASIPAIEHFMAGIN
jgi:hypothetical protein